MPEPDNSLRDIQVEMNENIMRGLREEAALGEMLDQQDLSPGVPALLEGIRRDAAQVNVREELRELLTEVDLRPQLEELGRRLAAAPFDELCQRVDNAQAERTVQQARHDAIEAAYHNAAQAIVESHDATIVERRYNAAAAEAVAMRAAEQVRQYWMAAYGDPAGVSQSLANTLHIATGAEITQRHQYDNPRTGQQSEYVQLRWREPESGYTHGPGLHEQLFNAPTLEEKIAEAAQPMPEWELQPGRLCLPRELSPRRTYRVGRAVGKSTSLRWDSRRNLRDMYNLWLPEGTMPDRIISIPAPPTGIVEIQGVHFPAYQGSDGRWLPADTARPGQLPAALQGAVPASARGEFVVAQTPAISFTVPLHSMGSAITTPPATVTPYWTHEGQQAFRQEMFGEPAPVTEQPAPSAMAQAAGRLNRPTPTLDAQFFAYLDASQAAQAATIGGFTRLAVREESAFRRIMPPDNIQDANGEAPVSYTTRIETAELTRLRVAADKLLMLCATLGINPDEIVPELPFTTPHQPAARLRRVELLQEGE